MILYRLAACRSTTDMWACWKPGPHVSGPTSRSAWQMSRVRREGGTVVGGGGWGDGHGGAAALRRMERWCCVGATG